MRKIGGGRIETRLASKDLQKFHELAAEKHLPVSEIAREALLFYLDQRETAAQEIRDTRVERRLKAIEDRYASLLVRVGLDVGTVMALLSSRIEAGKRREVMETCYQSSLKHFNKKLEGVARDMKHQLSERQAK